MIDVKEAEKGQPLFAHWPQDKLVEAVNELIRAQDELAETITEIYQWAAIYDSGQNAIELPKVK